jgi:dihydroorotate dehydrogenase
MPASSHPDVRGKRVPLLIKIAPDLTEEEKADIAAVALRTKIDGLIVSNTTISRPDSLKVALFVRAMGVGKSVGRLGD